MAELILGPVLRHVTDHSATIWVEVDAPCEVAVLGRTTPTFSIDRHHYALVVIEDLPPGSTTPYEVRLDDRVVWPIRSDFPASVIRTAGARMSPTLLFGSCRAAAPHEAPWTLTLAEDPDGSGVDALYAYGLRMMLRPPDTWPDVLVFTGDQVYADESSPQTRRRIAERRGGRSSGDQPPLDQVADFEEYCWLYEESWSQPIERWVLSVIPSMMIFDDHDVIDDWNISASWVEDMKSVRWWEDRLEGALMSYWVYQHLGNLSPDEIRAEGLLDALLTRDDGGDLLRSWARTQGGLEPPSDGNPATMARFSLSREFGRTRVVVLDSRNDRALEPSHRQLVRCETLDSLLGLAPPVDHLVIVSSLPVFVPGGLHDLQVWNEAVCDGAWGERLSTLGERLRRGLDLEDWPAFTRSFGALTRLLSQIADGPHAPETISVIGGDIHFSYVAPVELERARNMHSRVHQIVLSPIRNVLKPRDRRVLRFAVSRVGRAVGRALRRLARRPATGASWQLAHGPFFDNALGSLQFDGPSARMRIERARPAEDGTAELETVLDIAL